MIENSPPKGVSFSDLICTFVMSIVGFSFLFLQHQDTRVLRHCKILGNFLLLRYLKGLIYNSLAELRYNLVRVFEFVVPLSIQSINQQLKVAPDTNLGTHL